MSVDIAHTFSGDLTLELLRDGTSVKTLRRNSGGSKKNIVETYTLTAAEVGAANGRYTLKVVDNAAQDVGTAGVAVEHRQPRHQRRHPRHGGHGPEGITKGPRQDAHLSAGERVCARRQLTQHLHAGHPRLRPGRRIP